MAKTLTPEEKEARELAKAQEKQARELAKAQEKEARAKEKQEKEEQEQKALAISAAKAIEAARQYALIIEEIIEAGGECDNATLEAKLAWESQLERKVEGIGFANLRLENKRAFIEAIIAGYQNELKAIDRAQTGLKRYLKTCMEVAGEKSIKKNGGLFSVSLVEGRFKAVIDNQTALPFDFVEIVEVVRPHTDKIKEALEAGKAVPGAHLERGEDYVMIRGGKVNA